MLSFRKLTTRCNLALLYRLTASIYKQFGEFPWSGYNENDKGFLLDFALNTNEAGTIKHNLQYEAAVRDLIAVKNASFKVREQSGPTLKSAIRHIITVDRRDGTIFPTNGTLVQCTTEIAGLGGNVGFIKNELLLQSNWTPHKYVVSKKNCFTFVRKTICFRLGLFLS